MRKALIFSLSLAAALTLAACGKPEPPEPAVSTPADSSALTAPANPAPPTDAGPASEALPGDGSDHDSPPADDTGAPSAPAGTEVNPEEGEPSDPPQPLPEDGGADSPAQQPDPAEEEPRQPDPAEEEQPGPADPSDSSAGGFAVSEQMMELIRNYLSGQPGGSQQSGAGYDPTDFGLGAYQEYLDQIGSAEELRETAETLFPGVSDYDIDWDAAWQALEAGRSG